MVHTTILNMRIDTSDTNLSNEDEQSLLEDCKRRAFEQNMNGYSQGELCESVDGSQFWGWFNFNKSIFLLYQTDMHKSKQSRVLFGVFGSEAEATDAAKLNGLYSNESEVLIIESELNNFSEI